MKKTLFQELPIRSKTEMIHDIVEIIHCLHAGKKERCKQLIEDLKGRSAFLDESIQQAVLMFIEQVQFQQVYDPWHRVTSEVVTAADHLIEDLGFFRSLE